LIFTFLENNCKFYDPIPWFSGLPSAGQEVFAYNETGSSQKVASVPYHERNASSHPFTL